MTYPGEGLGLPASGRGAVATPLRRAGALVADVALFALADLVLVAALPDIAGLLLLLAVVVANVIVLPWRTGRTFGKTLFGLRAVRCVDGRADLGSRGLPLPVAVGRSLQNFCSPLLLISGGFMLADPDRRSLWDKACATAVVRG
ncbi:MAG TPA: RDD family protein [Mycobacteriales bacterium]|jgi:uncharacterized RDD family membrane protein YckC|nr:RDD family protein [Mycobacteriales bacterium]